MHPSSIDVVGQPLLNSSEVRDFGRKRGPAALDFDLGLPFPKLDMAIHKGNMDSTAELQKQLDTNWNNLISDLKTAGLSNVEDDLKPSNIKGDRNVN
jgi:hypothetical protein